MKNIFPNDGISHIGFVVDPSLDAPNQPVRTLASLINDPSRWYVIELSPSYYPPNLRDNVGRYFRTIFALCVRACLAKPKNKNDAVDTILSASHLHISKISSYLRGLNRNKVKAASPLLPPIRKCIHTSLFYPKEASNRNGLEIVWRNKAPLTSIFFWTTSEYESSPFAVVKEKPISEITAEGLNPTTQTLAPDQLAGIAEQILSITHGTSWLDLYLAGLIREAEITDYINVKLSETPPEPAEFNDVSCLNMPMTEKTGYETENTAYFVRMHGNSILFGSSGSGKTILLKRLAAIYAQEHIESNGTTPFPLFVKANYFGEIGDIDVYNTYTKSIVNIIGVISTSELEKLCHVDHSRKNTTPVNRTELLNALKEEIYSWVSDETNLTQSILLLDDFSGITPKHEYEFIKCFEIVKHLFRQIFVTTKHRTFYLSDDRFFTWLEIHKLTFSQIQKYVAQRYPEQAESIVTQFNQNNPRCFELIRRPFFLQVFREILDPDDPTNVQDTEGNLIESFIKEMIEQNDESEEFDKISAMYPEFCYCLTFIAKRSLDFIAEGKSQYLSYPSDVLDGCIDQSTLRTMLLWGEYLGILKESGLRSGPSFYPDHIIFEHDLFRDYFGALWIRQQHFDRDISQFSTIIFPNRIWDNAIKMFIQLTTDPQIGKQFVYEISKYDPELASDCIIYIPSWQPDEIRIILRNIELACVGSRTIQRSAKKVLNQLATDDLIHIFNSRELTPVEHCIVPDVLVERDDCDLKSLVSTLVDRSYDTTTPDIFLNLIARCKDIDIIKLLLPIIDNLLAEGRCSINYFYILQNKFDFKAAQEICSTIINSTLKHIIYLSTEFTQQEIDDLLNNSDANIKLIAAMKKTKWNDWNTFIRLFKSSGASCLLDPMLSLYISIWSHFLPDLESILIQWGEGLLQKEHTRETELISAKLLQIISSLNSVKSCSWMCDILDRLNIEQIFGILGNLRKNKSSDLLCQLLKKNDSFQSIFIRFSLRDQLSDDELWGMQKWLNNQVKTAMQNACQDSDLEFMLQCVFNNYLGNDVIEIPFIPLDTLTKIAPRVANEYKVYRFKTALLEKLMSKQYQTIIHMIIQMNINDLCNIFLSILNTSELNKVEVVHSLWQQILSFYERYNEIPSQIRELIEYLEKDIGIRFVQECRKLFE